MKRVHQRDAFEHWTHDAAIIPMQFWPMWRHMFEKQRTYMNAKWPAWQSETFLEKRDAVLRQIADQGPCSSKDVGEGEKRGSGGWWDWHPSKTALEYLWRSGDISISHRVGFQKVYDLTERVIPPELRTQTPDREEMIDWACRSALTRLGFATNTEIAAFFALISPQEAQNWCRWALSEGIITKVLIEHHDGVQRPAYILAKTQIEQTPSPSRRVRLLSPFDPMLRDRKRAQRLFGFHYRIEIFTPAPKRKYGYYVFPVLQGDRLIGRMDVKRQNGKLHVIGFWLEEGVKTGKERIRSIQAEVERAAKLAECSDIGWEPNWLK